MDDSDNNEQDSFDKLLLALTDQGFSLPYSASVLNHPNVKDLVKADEEAWQRNRNAIISALTDSEWIAQ
jgi:hypothetical protein